ncbi:uncharacterized protein LOC143919271 [Arctopsyche grandis]|uniref:uncharacterized protein LOC143919271 n=1 Tax=Arctopsyche grandis TaxID=121162 RepID=UPI00406D6746
MISRIEAFERWVYRRMLKIPWTKKISNEAVLGMMGRGRELVSVIKRRKMEYLGHMIRGPKYEFLRLITMGKIEGKKIDWQEKVILASKHAHVDRYERRRAVPSH